MAENERSGPVGIRAAAFNVFTLHPRLADLRPEDRERFLAGYGAALTDLAERADALDEAWRPLTRRKPDEVRRDRLLSLSPAEGVDEWLEAMRQKTLRALRFVATPDRLTAELVAGGIAVSPLFACAWPPVTMPGSVANEPV